MIRYLLLYEVLNIIQDDLLSFIWSSEGHGYILELDVFGMADVGTPGGEDAEEVLLGVSRDILGNFAFSIGLAAVSWVGDLDVLENYVFHQMTWNPGDHDWAGF